MLQLHRQLIIIKQFFALFILLKCLTRTVTIIRTCLKNNLKFHSHKEIEIIIENIDIRL